MPCTGSLDELSISEQDKSLFTRDNLTSQMCRKLESLLLLSIGAYEGTIIVEFVDTTGETEILG